MARKGAEIKVAYIFPDGHALLCYQAPNPLAKFGYDEYVEVIEDFCKSRFRGCIVIHDTGLLASIKGARAVWAKAPSIENGSNGSKELGLEVGYLSINNAFGHLAISSISGVFSGGYTYQPEEKWEEEFSTREVGNIWSEKKITKIHRSKKKD